MRGRQKKRRIFEEGKLIAVRVELKNTGRERVERMVNGWALAMVNQQSVCSFHSTLAVKK